MDFWAYRCYFTNMRPLFHPAPEDISVEGILHALSDPVRAPEDASGRRGARPREIL